LNNQPNTEYSDMEFEADEIVLKEGEKICDRCEGSGYEPKQCKAQWFRAVCKKCQGEKKVDWISNVTGVKEKDITLAAGDSSGGFTSFSSVVTSSEICIGNTPIREYIQEVAAKEVAKQVDTEILRILKEKEQQNNKGWRQIFDNGIIHKLMFFDYFKQKNKSKENPSTI